MSSKKYSDFPAYSQILQLQDIENIRYWFIVTAAIDQGFGRPLHHH